MKQVLPLFLPLVMVVSDIWAQDLADPNKPYNYLSTAPGYITINDINFSLPSGDTKSVYSGSFFGFTTIHGYQINRYFTAGAGTGASFYDKGTLIPLFMHIRFSLNMHTFTPVLFAEGGLLFDTNAKPVIYINPGIGIRYYLSHNLGINLGTGLYMLSGPSMESFLNLRLGLTFKPSGSGDRRKK